MRRLPRISAVREREKHGPPTGSIQSGPKLGKNVNNKLATMNEQSKGKKKEKI